MCECARSLSPFSHEGEGRGGTHRWHYVMRKKGSSFASARNFFFFRRRQTHFHVISGKHERVPFLRCCCCLCCKCCCCTCWCCCGHYCCPGYCCPGPCTVYRMHASLVVTAVIAAVGDFFLSANSVVAVNVTFKTTKKAALEMEMAWINDSMDFTSAGSLTVRRTENGWRREVPKFALATLRQRARREPCEIETCLFCYRGCPIWFWQRSEIKSSS